MSDKYSAGQGGMGKDVDSNEILVKERFDAAVGGISPDVVSLVGGGVAAGRGMRRRRRVQGVVGALAASALVVGALAASGALGSLFDSQGAPPADQLGRLVQLEPATPRGLAAAVMAHTEGLGTVLGVGGTAIDKTSDDAELRSGLTMEVGYRTSDGVKVDLQVVASPQTKSWPTESACASQPHVTCRQDVLPDGTTRLVMKVDTGDTGSDAQAETSKAHVIGVGILRDDQFVIALETVVNSESNPLTVDELQAIAVDRAVGIATTPDLNARGQDIPDFKNRLLDTSGDSSSSSGSGSASPPSTVTVPGSPESSSAGTAPPD
jgi:hypothetical protein